MRIYKLTADCFCMHTSDVYIVHVECLQLHSRNVCADTREFLEFWLFFACNVRYIEHIRNCSHAHIVNTTIRWLKMTSCCFGLVVRAIEVAMR